MIKLSVIIPFRCENESTHYLVDRLEDLLSSFPNNLPLEFLVIDSGSSLKYQEICSDICDKYQVKYLYHNTFGKPFSIGACRDFGVQHACGSAVSFLDVDLRVAPDFWQRLLLLMEGWGISKYKKSFLAIPCIYLTQEGTAEFIAADKSIRFTDFYLRYLQGDKSAVENMALCSSVMIVDRIHYLAVGGHDPEFRGHGYEDFELYHRLLCEEDIIPKTEDYYLDQKTWNTATYKGFRSHLAMIGRPAMMMNLFVVHLWHPRPKNTSFYSNKSMTHNRNIWIEKFKTFVETGRNPEPLYIKNLEHECTLFFAKWHNSPSAISIRDTLPFMGKTIYVDENYFIDKFGEFKQDDFQETIKNLNITRIIFPNPYGNEARLKIYQWCKLKNFPLYCYDRGALPDSWFFDPNGFNSDSASYSENYWNNPLTNEEKENIVKYIQECIFGSNFLEKQANRIGGEALAHKLQLGAKKVLFVPLQRPSDTVIKYMSGHIQSFSRFIEMIDDLAKSLISKGWVVLCKKHPLETEIPTLKYAQYVPEDTHFIDLLELADRVALINSGVGIYSMMMEKPTYIFGDAFYSAEGLNKAIKHVDFTDSTQMEALARDIIEGFKVDSEKMKQFIHYLVFKFYSFGTPKTTSRKETDGSLRTITTGIDFYQLRLNGKLIFDYERNKRPQLSTSAPLFERYALDLHLKKKQASVKKDNTGVGQATSTPVKPTVANPAPVKAADKTNPVKADSPRQEINQELKPADKMLISVVDYSSNRKQEIRDKKMAKFKRDPYKFFNDSKNPIVRMGRIFFRQTK